MDTVFIGSSSAAVGVLNQLQSAGILVKLVVSRPDRKAGRGKSATPTPVSHYARSVELPLITPGSWKDGTGLEEIRRIRSAVIVVASYGLLLPSELLRIPDHGVLNIHPSLLPAYRGPSPVVTAVLEGAGVTGVTVMELDEGLDTGPIVAQKEVRIAENESAEFLEKRLFTLGAQILIETLPGWASGKILARKQVEAKATYTRRFNKDDGQIDCTQTTAAIINQIRAFDPWPSTYVVWEGKLLKILEATAGADVSMRETEHVAGTGLLYKSADLSFPALKTSDGVLVLSKVQLEGRRAVAGWEFLNGYPNFIGAHL